MPNIARYMPGYGRRKPGAWARPDGADPLSKNLAQCWLLNEGGGLTVRDSVGFTTGTLSGAALPLWKPVLFGVGLSTGASGYVVNSSYAQGARITIAAWLQTPASFATNAHCVYNGNNAGGTTSQGPLLQIPAGQTNWTFTHKFVGTGSWSPTGFTALTSTWYHFVVSYDSSSTSNTPVFTLNGIKYATTTNAAPTGAVTLATGLTIGSTAGHASFWVGSVDHLLLWNRLLTDGEINWLYREPFTFVKLAPPMRSFFGPAAAGVGNLLWRRRRGVVHA